MDNTLKIPTHLEEAFKNFLDIAQFGMSDTDDPSLSDGEQEVLKRVRKYLGKELSTRHNKTAL